LSFNKHGGVGGSLESSRSKRTGFSTSARRSLRHLGSGTGGTGGTGDIGGSGGTGGPSLEVNLSKAGKKSSIRNLLNSAAPPSFLQGHYDDISIDDTVLDDEVEEALKQNEPEQISSLSHHHSTTTAAATTAAVATTTIGESGRGKLPRREQGNFATDTAATAAISVAPSFSRSERTHCRESFRKMPARRNTLNSSGHRRIAAAGAVVSEHGTNATTSTAAVSKKQKQHQAVTAIAASSTITAATINSDTAAVVATIKQIRANLDSSSLTETPFTNTAAATAAAAATTATNKEDSNNNTVNSISNLNKRTGGSMRNNRTIGHTDANAQATAKANRGSTFLHGITNLLLQDETRAARNLSGAGVTNCSVEENNSSSNNNDNSDKHETVVRDSENTNKTQQRPGLQGIKNILGSMRDIQTSLEKEKEEENSGHNDDEKDEGEEGWRPFFRAPRPLLDSGKAKPCSWRNRMRNERMDSRKKIVAAAKTQKDSMGPSMQPKKTDVVKSYNHATNNNDNRIYENNNNENTNENHVKQNAEDSEDENDLDTVATPSTSAEPKVQTNEDPPPPPQRKIVPRESRNRFPMLNRHPTLSSVKSHGGMLVPTGSQDVATTATAATPVTSSKPVCVDTSVMTPLVTPNMSVATHNGGTDIVVTPGTAPDTPAATTNNGHQQSMPPPPPDRNSGNAPRLRWKDRAKNCLPTMARRLGPTPPTFDTSTPPPVAIATAAATARVPAITMLSPGGIVIEVNPAAHSNFAKTQTKNAKLPITPSSLTGELTPANSSVTPYHKAVKRTPSGTNLRSTTNGIINEVFHGYYPRVPITPSAQSSFADISELTPGTHFNRMTPTNNRHATTSTGGIVSSTPATSGFYNSVSGIISELTPGGWDEDESLRLKTPNTSTRSQGRYE